MTRPWKFAYYLVSTALAAGAAYAFFGDAGQGGGFFAKLCFIAAAANYIYSLVYFAEFVLGRPLGEIEVLWARLHDRPVRKFLISLSLMGVFIVLLGVPVVAGAALSRG
jgi:hypothetical protein